MSDVVIFRGRRVVLPTGESASCVMVSDGSITAIEPYENAPAGRVIEIDDGVLLPGLVDTHVHLNDPGRADWEGFDTGTAAAAAGGVTTLIDMPLNSIPATTTVAALAAKRAAAQGRCRVDVGFWGGVVPENGADVAALWHGGVFGFKCFLAPSGVAEFGHVAEAHLVHVLPQLAEFGAPLLVHAELPAALGALDAAQDARAYATYLASRPDAAEVDAVRLLIELCRETRVRMHVVHVASADVLPLLRAARAEGLPITAETCPHYLHFTAASVPQGGTAWKCAPPIRATANREQLWRGLASRDLDMIVSDHSPAPPAVKRGDFATAWGGIASLQLGLPVVWTDARAREHGLADIARWLAAEPARLAGLTTKGAIAVGCDADFVVFDPAAEWTVTRDAMRQRHPATPYLDETLTGMVRATYLRGERVWQGGAAIGEPRGRLLQRT